MKKIISITLIFVLSAVALFATNLRNDAGRWLQVDCYNSNGDAIDTLNMRANDNDEIPTKCYKIKIRVNGNSIIVSGSQIVITKEEKLVKEK